MPAHPTADNTFCGWEAKIKVQKVFTGEKAESIGSMWRGMQESWMGVGCFDPAFIFRFYQKDKLLVESCVCFHCSKITLPDGKEHNFDPQSEGAEKLLEFVKGIIGESQEPQVKPKN
ncbi:MAG: hypothetical protein K1Y36_02080 [Blastocatellia bacterium]|nr:hypothetical protein [Blastocatellia bacterium]